MTPVSGGFLTCLVRGFVSAVQATDWKNRIITTEEADEILENLHGEGLHPWKLAVKKTSQEQDWDDLIALLDANSMRKPPYCAREKHILRLAMTFHQTYRGEAVNEFIRALEVYNNIYTPSKHFGRCIPVVQSSGTGKSRLVQELGKKVLTLIFAFGTRSPTLPPQTVGHPATNQPTIFFTSNRNPHMGEELAAAFLGALMDVVADKLLARVCSTSLFQDWMKDWELDNVTNLIESSRHKCFLEVEKRALALLTTQDVEKLRIPTLSVETCVKWHFDLYTLLCLPHAQKLVRLLDSLNLSVKNFLFAFDDCSSLNVAQEAENPLLPQTRASLISLQRIIKAADTCGPEGNTALWYLFLDKNPYTPLFAPSCSIMPESSSGHERNHTALPHWLYIGFNQMVDDNHLRSIKTPADALSLNHQKAYGRPCWSYVDDKQVADSAFRKLFSAYSFNSENIDHVFAVFNARVGLEIQIGDGKVSARLAVDAVRNHMRIFLGVVHGSFPLTASPSEPILAIAATQVLLQSRHVYQTAVGILVEKLIQPGLVVDRGLPGDLYTRMLFTLARDTAIYPEQSIVTDIIAGVDGIEALRLSNFLQMIVGLNFGIDASQRDLRTRLIKDTSNAWVNFTHFVQLSEIVDEVTPTTLMEAWSSCIAYQCANNQPMIRGFIVAYRGDLHQALDPENFFMVPWQIPVGVKSLPQKLTGPILVDTGPGSTQKRWKTELLVIYMDFDTSDRFETGVLVDLTYAAPVRPEAGKWAGYARKKDPSPERFCLNIRGHSDESYPAIERFIKFETIFQHSLARNTHPKLAGNAREMQAAMQKLKGFR